MIQKSTARIGWILLFMLTVAFSIKNFIEPDLWWQLAAGDRVLQSGKLLFNDPFTYTFPNAPWINIKWLTELFMIGWVNLVSPEMLPCIQVMISIGLVVVLINTARIGNSNVGSRSEHLAVLIGVLLFLVMSEFRMNSRPEMFSHFLMALSVYFYSRYMKQPGKIIYAILPIQLLWVNMHDGYAIGLFLAAFYLCMNWLRWLVAGVGAKPVHLSRMVLLMIPVVCFNPNGYHLLWHWMNIFGQFTGFQFTTEFLDYTSYQYWTKESYMAMAMFAVVLLDYLFGIFRQVTPELKARYLKRILATELIKPLLLMGVFWLFALMGYRNIIYLNIIVVPHFIQICQGIIGRFNDRFFRMVHSFLLGLMLVLYGLIVSHKYYQFTGSRNRFGFEMSPYHQPINTANYLQSKQIKGNVFSDYLSSAYLLWHLRPEFKVFIDLRDYEIYSPEFFANYATITSSGEAFLKADSQYHFQAVVLLTKNSQPLHKYLYQSSTFKLTHLDAMCAVYERTSTQPQVEYTFNAVTSQVIWLNRIFNPWYVTYYEDSDLEWERAAIYYTAVGDFMKAYAAIQHVQPNGIHADIYAEGAGNYYLNLARLDTSVNVRIKLDSAAMYFTRAIKFNKKRTGAYNGLGAISYGKQSYKQAVKWWEEALEIDQDNLQIHLYLADCYEKLAEFSNAHENYQMEIKHLLLAYKMNPDNPFIETDLGFIYSKLNRCEDAVPYLKRIENFNGISKEDRELARYYLSRCQ